jgi:Family of unknown function (DUF6427)
VTGIFKANNPSGNGILFIYAIVLKLPMFLHMRSPQLQPLDGVLYKSILQIFNPVAAVFSPTYSILTFSLLFAQAIGFNKIVNTQRLHKQNNYLTGMSYLLITSLFSDWFSFSAPLIVNTFMIWIWAKLCTLYNNPHPKATIFNIGLVAGIAAFIYFPSITFLLLIFVGIAIARPFRLQEWLTVLVGIITPLYIFAAILFLTDNVGSYKYPGFHFSYPHFFGNRWAYAALFIVFFTTAIGLYFVNNNISRQVVQTRKSWQLLFLYIIVAATVPFINTAINFSYWILLAIPISPVIAAAFFYPQKKIFATILHWIMFGIFVAIGFFGK